MVSLRDSAAADGAKAFRAVAYTVRIRCAVGIAHLKLKRASAAAPARPCAAPPHNAILLPIRHKVQLDAHIRPAEVYEFVGVERIDRAAGSGRRARRPPQRPSDSVQKRRLAMSVIAAKARHMDAVEAKRRHILAVAHKVLQGETKGDHGRASLIRFAIWRFVRGSALRAWGCGCWA